MLTHERGKHLHHGRMVSRGVAGDTLQGVDTAETDVRLPAADLFNGLGIAIQGREVKGRAGLSRVYRLAAC